MRLFVRYVLLIVFAMGAVLSHADEQFKPNGLVILLTDYGTDSIYMGIIRGAIYSKFPGAHVDDMTNAVPPYDIIAGAYLLAEAAGVYPKGTVFVTIVDPGVGTPRKPIVLETKNGFCFVGPDNGLLTLVAEQFGVKQIRELTNKEYWRAGTTSTVFHGRDIFGPVGASLASGLPVEKAGPALDGIVKLDLPRSKVENGTAIGTVTRTDPYGNMITNITAKDLETLGLQVGDTVRVTIGKSTWSAPYKRTYAEVKEGERLVVIQSAGFVECAINKGNLVEAINESFGAAVSIRRAN